MNDLPTPNEVEEFYKTGHPAEANEKQQAVARAMLYMRLRGLPDVLASWQGFERDPALVSEEDAQTALACLKGLDANISRANYLVAVLPNNRYGRSLSLALREELHLLSIVLNQADVPVEWSIDDGEYGEAVQFTRRRLRKCERICSDRLRRLAAKVHAYLQTFHPKEAQAADIAKAEDKRKCEPTDPKVIKAVKLINQGLSRQAIADRCDIGVDYVSTIKSRYKHLITTDAQQEN